jgi:hypothetical protein
LQPPQPLRAARAMTAATCRTPARRLVSNIDEILTAA